MTHFEAYRWEDHVPRAGSWKFNLAAGTLALALIATALPDADGSAPAFVAAPSETHQPSSKPTVQTVKSAYCPTAKTDHADS
jgi:hypothetical protein